MLGRHWLVPVAALAAACSPPPVEVAPITLDPGVDAVLVVIHGGNDTPATWAEGLADDVIAHLDDPRWQAVVPDWSDASSRLTSAGRSGRTLGELLAAELGDLELRAVHVIAHSVGTYAAHALTENRDDYTLHVTYLDAFVGLGGFGRSRFGVGADFAEHVLNRGDGVPTTNGALDAAWNLDVTALRTGELASGSDAHWWPISWYRGSGETGVGLGVAGQDPAALAERFEAGVTEVAGDDEAGMVTALDVDPDG